MGNKERKIKIPYHIAIIMDGNGRWAKKRGLPRVWGHRKGVQRVKEIVQAAYKLGIKMLTLFAFSTENWSRPLAEREKIFSYLEDALEKQRNYFKKYGIKLLFIGRRDRISAKLREKIKLVEKETRNNQDFILTIALDYGGRWDILQACKKILSAGILPQEITEDNIKEYICLGKYPEPDLLIRTSGEKRISNFMLWQLAYSELYFPKILWPDFSSLWLERAIKEYKRRKRRFGGLTNKG